MVAMKKDHRTAIWWVRRDLRLADNPALAYAVGHAEHIVPIYIYDCDEPWPPGAASAWWLHHSLVSLTHALSSRDSGLIVRDGAALRCLLDLVDETGATLVAWNRLYEPAAIRRDATVETKLRERDVAVASHNAALLAEPATIRNGEGKPYRVFTPFWRAVQAHLHSLPPPARAPRRLLAPKRWPKSRRVDELNLLPKIDWDSGFARRWQPGETGALKQMRRFDKVADTYSTGRDRPDVRGTSSLSPHLHFGEIGPRQLFAGLRLQSPAGAGHESRNTFARELGWREFAHHLLYHFPHTVDQPLDPRFAAWRWSKSRRHLRAWQRGCTGIPIVDAGMRELWHTGWMHNRVRMIVASFLTKNLQIDWRDGTRWFWDTLVDADLANNTLGWQWTAGCGADAAPYFRVFNPVLQAEKFDPQRRYLRQWLPELVRLPDRWIHQPWGAPEQTLAMAGVILGDTYPKPIVDLQKSRTIALASYEHMKQNVQQ
jgi:deoxyribodipyrimidine photo-lyase